MSSTANLALPLVAAAQAQKHVTVNEAFERIDALSQLTLASASTTVPPSNPGDGAVYAVPVGAVNEWSAEVGKLAVFLNGGWDFVSPAIGWRAWVQDLGVPAVFTGVDWVAGAQGVTANAATFALKTVESDHVLTAGATYSTTTVLPSHAIVFAVTGIVTDAMTGTLTSWDIGVASAPDRYSSGLGLSQGTWFRGVTSAPQTYYADTALLLTANGGDFAGGALRIAVHLAEFTIPNV